MDKELYQSVFDFTCKEKVLKSFKSSDFDFKALNDGHSFIYSIELINEAIDKYLNGKITASHLSAWCGAYWLILISSTPNATDKNQQEDHHFKGYIEYDILNWLDIIANYNKRKIDKYIKSVREKIQNLDKIYRMADNLTVYLKDQNIYQMIKDLGEDSDDIYYMGMTFLCIDNKTKTFFVLDNVGELYYHIEKVDEKRLVEDKFNAKIEELKQIGFQQVKYDV